MTSFDALTDLENLRLFIQERIRVVDPSLDTSTGSEIDTELIQPLLDRLGPDPYDVPIRDFILGRLKTEFPDLILQDGEPIDDYGVKVMQILLEPFRRQIQQISNNQSVANTELLNETEADNLGANYFLTRELGEYATGAARLYFNAPQYAQVAPSNVVSTGSGLRFFPVETQAITLDSMLFNTENNLYYFDVIVRAEEQGDEYNIAENTLTTIADLPAVVKVSNKVNFEGGLERESTEDFLSRVERSLTEKSLVTVRGIDARLTEIFESIRLLAIIGFGDPEMNRDIIEGTSEPAPYAYGRSTSSAGAEMTIDSIFTEASGSLPGVGEAGVQAGDVVTQIDYVSATLSHHTVTRIIDNTTLEVEPSIPDMTDRRFAIRTPDAGITISDIPGGITGGGTIGLISGQVHIGGALDVFVRAGDPQSRNTTIEGVLDGSPLHFGVDLESFGENDERLTHIAEPLGYCHIPDRNIYGEELTIPNQILVVNYDPSTGKVPWHPTEDDVGRYIQLLGDGGGLAGQYGTYGILAVEGEEYYVNTGTTPYTYSRCVRITIGDATTGDVYDEESGNTWAGGLPLAPSTGFDTLCRPVDKLSRKNVVRDRDASTTVITDVGEPDILGGVDFSNLGTEIGDSVVIETGDDAGIYSARRILSWLNTGDSIVLDRDLTKTVHPSGTGNGTGLRYRIADELNLDLVSPKVTKIPLGSVFTGDDLESVAGSSVVTVSSSTNFLLAGVEEGDTLEVLDGPNAGTYQIVSVTGTSATLDSTMPTTSFSQTFSAYRAYTGVDRPLVRVKTVELLDSSSQPTGVIIPYGDAVDARVLGVLGNRAEGEEVESYSGVTGTGGGSELIRLSDAERDFVAEGITAGYRLNILNTLNAGEYTIADVASGYVDVELAADGGLEFRTSESGVHYTIGLPSSGFVRLYFQEPTSVEIQTGLNGGRLSTDDDTPKEFRFSDVEGYYVLPSGGSGETFMRDLRVVNSDFVGGGNVNTLIEFTDDSNPTAFESEIQVGDVIDVYEDIKFRNLKPLNATYTWNGTTTVSSSDTSEVHIGHYIRLDSDGRWFKITNVTYNTSVTIDAAGLTPPTGSTQSSASATFKQLCVVGSPAGLSTISGSNLVSIPNGSLIDFTAMSDLSELVGQNLRIDSGPDEGEYVIEEVVSSKQLRLDRVMTVTTESIVSQGSVDTTQWPQRDPYLEPSGSKTDMTDPTNNPGTIPERYITVYETTRGDYDGTYQVTDIPTPGTTVELDADPADPGGDMPNPKDLRTLIGTVGQTNGAISGGSFSDPDDDLRAAGVRIGDTLTVLDGVAAGRYIVRTHPTAGVGGSMTVSDLSGAAPPNDTGFNYEIEASGSVDPFGVGRFNWVLTANETPVSYPFRVFSAAPTEAQIIEVAPRTALRVGPERGRVEDATNFYDYHGTNFGSVARGDLLEILTGPNAGVYPIASVVDLGHLTIYGAPSPNVFFVAATDLPYKIWGGLHGPPRMLKVGPWQSFNGQLDPGEQVHYKLRRPSVHRIGSTEMSENEDNNLYYTDIQIESQGSGDTLNLAENTRMVIDSGMRVDGYTYTVDNNRLTFSPYEEVSLDFNRRFLPVGNSDNPENLTEISGRNIKITYEASTVTKLVNDLLRSEYDRPVNADPIGRHFLPSYVFTSFEFSGGGLSADEIGAEIEEAINRTGAEESLKVSDLEAIITRKGATYVRHPITLVSITHDIDRNLIVDRSEDTLGGYNIVSFNGTGRISAFFAILGEGLTVEKI